MVEWAFMVGIRSTLISCDILYIYLYIHRYVGLYVYSLTYSSIFPYIYLAGGGDWRCMYHSTAVCGVSLWLLFCAVRILNTAAVPAPRSVHKWRWVGISRPHRDSVKLSFPGDDRSHVHCGRYTEVYILLNVLFFVDDWFTVRSKCTINICIPICTVLKYFLVSNRLRVVG